MFSNCHASDEAIFEDSRRESFQLQEDSDHTRKNKGGRSRDFERGERRVLHEYCHDPNSRRLKIWPMTLGQRFDPKGSS